jgi:formate dehydrogenase major subunit
MGTPEKTVRLVIDGIDVTVPEGTSVMRASMEAGIAGAEALRHRHGRGLRLLPALCGRDRGPQRHARLLHDAGGRGHGRPHPDRKVKKIRRGVMELYISDHPLDCLTCAANGDCELQDMAGAVGLRDVRYGYDGANHFEARQNGEANPRMDAEGRVQPLFHL